MSANLPILILVGLRVTKAGISSFYLSYAPQRISPILVTSSSFVGVTGSKMIQLNSGATKADIALFTVRGANAIEHTEGV
jgi:hypothetical protein